MILKIRKDIDPVLRQPTEEIVDFGHELQFLIDNIIETMRKNSGIGLAAPQVGVSKKLFVCEFAGEKDVDLPSFPLTIICNPKIVHLSEKQKEMVEGCLSFPGLELLIKRPEEVVIKGQDRYGKEIEIKADKLYARVIEHENDHLNSTLYIDHLKEISVVFIGTGTLGLKSLELLQKDPQYKVMAVLTSKEKKVISRKKHSEENPIEAFAKKNKITLFKTSSIRNDQKIIDQIKKLQPDIGIMADFGQIIPEQLLQIPKYGIVNIHPSLLPKHRGPSPIHQTILDGDEEGGVTLILTTPSMDAGQIISQATVELSKAETSSMLKNYLSKIGASLLLNSIPYYIAGDLKPIKQKKDDITYSKIIKPEDAFIDPSTDKVTADRKIRAFDTWPKAYTIVNNKRIQLVSGHFEEDGEYVINRVKPEGRSEMSYDDFLRGYKIELKFK